MARCPNKRNKDAWDDAKGHLNGTHNSYAPSTMFSILKKVRHSAPVVGQGISEPIGRYGNAELNLYSQSRYVPNLKVSAKVSKFSRHLRRQVKLAVELKTSNKRAVPTIPKSESCRFKRLL